MGIPAIVGTQEAARILKEGQLITVDAYNGIIYEGKTILTGPDEEKAVVSGSYPSNATTITKIKGNLAFPQREKQKRKLQIRFSNTGEKKKI